MKIDNNLRMDAFEEAAYNVVSEIEDFEHRTIALTCVVDVLGVLYDLPAEDLDEIQNRIFKRLEE